MRTITLILVAVALALATPAWADLQTLTGTFSGPDADTSQDNGLGNHHYDIDRSIVYNVPLVQIWGTVDVSGLQAGSYLQIGLIDKEQADMSMDSFGVPGYMFNNSAMLTFFSNNTAKLIDKVEGGTIGSAAIANPGATAGEWNFQMELDASEMRVSMDGGSTWTSQSYGVRNWWDGAAVWSGGELEYGAYALVQMWVDTGDTVNPASADYDVTVVPVPAAVVLGGIGLGLVGWVKRRRK